MKRLINRRRFLKVGAGLAGTMAAGALLPRGFAFSQGQPALAVPTIDKLSIRVITDGAYDLFLGPQNLPGLKVERASIAPQKSTHTLHNQWGLSLYLESVKGGEQRNQLLDFGYTSEALINNMDLLKVDPAKIHGLILSHGHFDHFGGLEGFLEKKRDALPANLALYVGGEEAFCRRLIGPPGQQVTFGKELNRNALGAARVATVLGEAPRIIEGHAFTTGMIPRGGFEKVLSNTMVEYSKHGNLGCDLSHFLPAEQLGKIVPDQHLHEHATCFNLKDRGLVVITSCGHAGIVNTIRQAQKVSGVKKLHALVGGFHLGPAPADYVEQSVLALKEMNPDYVIPMHCSGVKFTASTQNHMPGKLVLSSTGSLFTFAA